MRKRDRERAERKARKLVKKVTVQTSDVIKAENQKPRPVEEAPAPAPVAKPKRISTKIPSPHLAKPCPKCGAPAGSPCISAKPPAYSVDLVHKARVVAYDITGGQPPTPNE